MKGNMVEFSAEGEFIHAYVSTPPSGSGPGVIVLQEWWGLVGHIKDVADRFAAEGFTAIAPDLYKGKTTTEPDEADSLMMALHIGETEKTLKEVGRYLLQDCSTNPKQGIGVVGFCMGGQLAMFAAGHNPKIKATVNFYGIHPNVAISYRHIQGAVMGVFAEHDDSAPHDVVRAMAMELTAEGIDHDFKTYPGTHHAFFNNDRPEVYNAGAAEDAWKRTVKFLHDQLD